MPKKYGKVVIDNSYRGRLICNECGYSWQATEEEMHEAANKQHQISCLMCRAMNSIKVGQLIPKNTQYSLLETVKTNSPDELREDNYYNKEVLILHRRCNKTSKVKLIDLRSGNIECKHCKNTIKHPIAKGKPNIEKDGIVEVFEQHPVIDTENKVKLKDGDTKLGKMLPNGMRIMEIDNKRDTYTVQCALCGTEETRGLTVLKACKVKNKTLLCSRCNNSTISLGELKRAYIGKVFNGQQIDKIYYGENNEALCDLICMQNKRNTTLTAYISTLNSKDSSNTRIIPREINIMHTQLGVPLGDVINKRCYCKICGTEKLPDYMLKRLIPSHCKARLARTDITNEEFYKNVRTKSVCDFCAIQSTCKLAGIDQRNSLGIVSTLIDMENSLLGEMLDLTVDYPSMFQFKESDGKNVYIRADKDLIIIKEAFLGSEGSLYRTCKCRKHGTELTLTDAEIENFEHKQCIEANSHMRFFDIQQQFYLKLSK